MNRNSGQGNRKGPVCLGVCVTALLAEAFDGSKRDLVWECSLTIFRKSSKSRSKVRVAKLKFKHEQDGLTQEPLGSQKWSTYKNLHVKKGIITQMEFPM